MAQTTNPIQSLTRAFEILEILSAHPRGIALTELSRAAGLSKSTVHRFLVSLGETGYVAKEDGTGKYRLTLRMFEIGSRAVHALDILDIARPYLDHMVEATGETVHLVLREETKVVYIYKYNLSAAAVNMASGIGNCSPIYCTGVGKAILAYLSPEEIRRVWEASNITRFTENTITDFEAMQKELAEIRDRGCAFDNEEHERGIFCVAAPIFDYSGYPKYAISISAPSVRVSEARRQSFMGMVRHAATEISAMLGVNPAAFGVRIPSAAVPRKALLRREPLRDA